MYKVFVNEKLLTINNFLTKAEKNLKFEGLHTLEIALDILENTSYKEVNVFDDDTEFLWNEFKKIFKVIEAAGGVVENSQREILFIFRIGKWDLPKGKIEPNELEKIAAVREVEEETGATDLVLEDKINETYHTYTEKDGTRVLKKTNWYRMKYSKNEMLKPQVEEGITEVKWFSQSDIKSMVFGNTFKNIELVLSEYYSSI